MSRVEEIATALKGSPTPLFLIGVAAEGQRDLKTITQEIIKAGRNLEIETEIVARGDK